MCSRSKKLAMTTVTTVVPPPSVSGMGLYPICYPPTVDERVDILDAGGRPTGRIAWKSEAHRDGLWHRCFHLWICDPEGPYLLVQRSEEHTSELQSRQYLVCRLLLEKKK